MPTITITGLVPLGAPTNVPRGRVSSGYQVVDNLTWARRSHVFKAGGEYRRAIVNSFNDQLARGRLNFDSLADFLAGRSRRQEQLFCASPHGATRSQITSASSCRTIGKSQPA